MCNNLRKYTPVSWCIAGFCYVYYVWNKKVGFHTATCYECNLFPPSLLKCQMNYVKQPTEAGESQYCWIVYWMMTFAYFLNMFISQRFWKIKLNLKPDTLWRRCNIFWWFHYFLTYSYMHPKQLKHGSIVTCWACCCKKNRMRRNDDLDIGVDIGVVWMLDSISITIAIQQVYFGFMCQGNQLPLSTRDVCQWSKLYLSSPPFKLIVASVGGFAQTTVMFYKLMRDVWACAAVFTLSN